MKKPYIYPEMPAVMTDELTERQTREKIVKAIASIWRKVEQLRANGLKLDTYTDLKQNTPAAIKAQIAATRQARLGNRTLLLPQSIRQREEKEFKELENVLVPLAEELQNLLQAYPFTVHVGLTEASTYFDSEQVEAFIEKQSTVQIPADVREFYAQVQKVCASWAELTDWCQEHNFSTPTRHLLSLIADGGRFDNNVPDHLQECTFSFSVHQMFDLYRYGHVCGQ